jgi:hypothetical protein
MNEVTEKIPKNHGEFYFDPPFSQWKEEALRNRERNVKEIYWGQNALKVREILKLPTDQPLILSGHQPVFFHPGLWVKCLAASLLAEAVQGTACHKLTDTALVAEYEHYLPEVEEMGQARRKRLEFFHSKDHQGMEKTTPYSFMPSPDYEAVHKIFSEAQVFCPNGVKESMKGYEEKFMKGLKDNAAWNDFHLFTLKLLDELCQTKRVFLQGHKLWSSEPFFKFLAYWMGNLPELTEAYNQSLVQYRQIHQIQHDLSPFPNLKFEDWWFEIPFWGVTKYHQRHSLWAKTDGKHLILKMKGGDGNYSVALDNMQAELGTLPIMIWPKAMPQTLFCRMYLCDYFIHGMGGGNYEEVNDIFFEKIFKVKALEYGVATATYLVDPEESGAIETILNHEQGIEWWERALEKNPEYLFTKKDIWQAALPAFMVPKFLECFNDEKLKKLAAEKERLIGSLKDPAKKAEASQKIKEVNSALYEGYTEPLKALEQGLLDISKIKATREVLGYREYPFFAFKPETFQTMKENVRKEVNKA